MRERQQHRATAEVGTELVETAAEAAAQRSGANAMYVAVTADTAKQ